jgi:hypothetical protein
MGAHAVWAVEQLSYRIPYKNETLGHIRVGAPAEEPHGTNRRYEV